MFASLKVSRFVPSHLCHSFTYYGMLIRKDFPWKFEDTVPVSFCISCCLCSTESLLSPSHYSQKAFRVFPLSLMSEMSPRHSLVGVFHFVCPWLCTSAMGTCTLGSTPVLTLGHCLLCLVSVLCPPCLLSLSPEDLFNECWELLGSSSDSLDPLYTLSPCPFLLFWENSLAHPFNLFSCQRQCFCPLTESFILLQSSNSSFPTSLKPSFLWAISFYFSLRILIICVPVGLFCLLY